MSRFPDVRLAFGVMAILVWSRVGFATSTDAASLQRPQGKPKPRVIVLTWDRVPVCLQASASRRTADNRSPSLGWTSTRREIPTAKGAVSLQLQDDQAVLKIGSEAVTIGADEQGRQSRHCPTAMPRSTCSSPTRGMIDRRRDVAGCSIRGGLYSRTSLP